MRPKHRLLTTYRLRRLQRRLTPHAPYRLSNYGRGLGRQLEFDLQLATGERFRVSYRTKFPQYQLRLAVPGEPDKWILSGYEFRDILRAEGVGVIPPLSGRAPEELRTFFQSFLKDCFGYGVFESQLESLDVLAQVAEALAVVETYHRLYDLHDRKLSVGSYHCSYCSELWTRDFRPSCSCIGSLRTYSVSGS